MDFILTSKKWKNTIKDVHTGSKHDLDTDHNPLMGRLSTKFPCSQTNTFTKPEKPPYLLPPDEQQVQAALEEFQYFARDKEGWSYKTWMQNWIQAARNNFSLRPKELFKSWISTETKQLIDQRTLAASMEDKVTWALLNQAVKKHARYDKRAFF